MTYMTMDDVRAKLGQVDDLDAAERAQTDHALRAALDMARPVNWWGTGASQQLLRAAREEGLPLAWVPRSKIIKEVAKASSPEERLAVLVNRYNEVLDDCKMALAECEDDELASTQFLALRAIDAIEAGHFEAGMALAVSVAEPLAIWASTPRVRGFWSKEDRQDWEKQRRERRPYSWARIEIERLPPGEVSPWDFRYQVLIAPIPRFFTPFWADRGDPVPAGLSRHVVAHQPIREHFSKSNALLSVMLVASILRDQQEWIEEVRFADEPS